MPLFFTPNPRKFTYQPRFYDPEKEEWEARKKKYAADQQREEQQQQQRMAATEEGTRQPADSDSVDLAYFERRLGQIDSAERKKKNKLQLSDFFRKRETPTFHYEPRFSNNADGGTASNGSTTNQDYKRKHKIARRFDIADSDYMKPVSAGKIMLYALLTVMLLMWIVL